jgi:hypothetical protein
MSRFDTEHEAAWKRQAEREAEAFVVGATVYRPKYDRIQAGTVRTAGRCNNPDGGCVEDGRFPYYAASFLNAPGCNPEWVTQTFSYHFFATEAEARGKLVRDIENRIKDEQIQLRRLEALLASVRAGVVLDAP